MDFTAKFVRDEIKAGKLEAVRLGGDGHPALRISRASYNRYVMAKRWPKKKPG